MSNGNLAVHHSVTASELRYVFRFWLKSEDPVFKANNNAHNPQKQNHEIVYNHMGNGLRVK